MNVDKDCVILIRAPAPLPLGGPLLWPDKSNTSRTMKGRKRRLFVWMQYLSSHPVVISWVHLFLELLVPVCLRV